MLAALANQSGACQPDITPSAAPVTVPLRRVVAVLWLDAQPSAFTNAECAAAAGHPSPSPQQAHHAARPRHRRPASQRSSPGASRHASSTPTACRCRTRRPAASHNGRRRLPCGASECRARLSRTRPPPWRPRTRRRRARRWRSVRGTQPRPARRHASRQRSSADHTTPLQRGRVHQRTDAPHTVGLACSPRSTPPGPGARRRAATKCWRRCNAVAP